MKLSDLNKFFFYLIIFLNLSISNAQEEVDIWKKDNSNNKAINLWVVSDNLLKGAALNTVQIAQCLMKKN